MENRELWKRSGVLPRHRAEAAALLAAHDGPWGAALARMLTKAGTGYVAVFHGDRGTGKTQAAACLCLDATRRGRRAEWLTARDLFARIKASWGNGGPSEADVLAALARPALLVIDEAQVRADSQWADDTLTALVDRRYGLLRDTVLVTNETPEQFVVTLGTSIISRMEECGGAMHFHWPSFRGGDA